MNECFEVCVHEHNTRVLQVLSSGMQLIQLQLFRKYA